MARVDTSIDVNYGARANEEGFRVLVQALAVTAVETFDKKVTTDEDRYRALMERTPRDARFDGDTQSPTDIHAEIAVAGSVTRRRPTGTR